MPHTGCARACHLRPKRRRWFCRLPLKSRHRQTAGLSNSVGLLSGSGSVSLDVSIKGGGANQASQAHVFCIQGAGRIDYGYAGFDQAFAGIEG